MKSNVRLMRFCAGLICAISFLSVLFATVGYVGLPELRFDDLLQRESFEPSTYERLVMIREAFWTSTMIGSFLNLALLVTCGLSGYLYVRLKPEK